MKKDRIVFICLFIFIFLITLLNYLFIKPSIYSEMEKRKLAEMPEINISDMFSGEFMSKYEEYVNDHMIFRDDFIKISSYFKFIMGNREINDVVIGEDNYLFNKFDYTKEDKERVEKGIGYLNKFGKMYENVSIMLIPTAEEVLSDKLPKYYSSINQKELIEEIYNKLEINTIDCCTLLKENKLGLDQVYYKTDHHWTLQGSYYGYLALCNNLGIKPVDYSKLTFSLLKDNYKGSVYSKINILNCKDSLYRVDSNKVYKYDVIINEDGRVYKDLFFEENLRGIDNYSLYLGGNNPIVRVTSSGVKNNNKLLLIKDSFSHTLVPYLVHNYSEIVLVDLRYYNLKLSELIEKEKFTDIAIVYNLDTLKNENKFILLTK